MDKQFAAYDGRQIRLPDAQRRHIEYFHPEALADEEKIALTVGKPDLVATGATENTRIVYKLFPNTPVSEKYLAIVLRLLNDEGFIVTAYLTDRVKRANVIWRRTS